MNAVAATGVPIQPSSISLRLVWMPAPKKVSGAQPTRTPFSFAAAITLAPSLRSTASGFSQWTFLPAAMAARLTAVCAFGVVRLMTILMSGFASSSSAVQATGTLCSAARFWARLMSISATATRSRISNMRQPLMYAGLMLPHPMMPTGTFATM